MHTSSLFELLDHICPDIHATETSSTHMWTCSSIKEGCSSEEVLNPAAINTRNPETGRTMLHEAAASGDCATFRQLIKNGADINKQKFLGGESALHVAAAHGHKSVAAEIMRHDNSDPNIRNKYKATPLHYATNTAIAELLISYDVILDLAYSNNRTPLQAVIVRPTASTSDCNKELIK